MKENGKILAIVERGRGKGNFSCFSTEEIAKCLPVGYGKTAREAMEDIKKSVEEFKEMKAEEGEEFPEVEFSYRFDVGAFFDFYPIDVTAFARYAGINASVLRQYATALRQPKQDALNKIHEGINRLSKDLGADLLITQPVTSYV